MRGARWNASEKLSGIDFEHLNFGARSHRRVARAGTYGLSLRVKQEKGGLTDWVQVQRDAADVVVSSPAFQGSPRDLSKASRSKATAALELTVR
eukprot:762817-Hanusia_phi.AAC.3